jgi:hypothetical protein
VILARLARSAQSAAAQLARGHPLTPLGIRPLADAHATPPSQRHDNRGTTTTTHPATAFDERAPRLLCAASPTTLRLPGNSPGLPAYSNLGVCFAVTWRSSTGQGLAQKPHNRLASYGTFVSSSALLRRAAHDGSTEWDASACRLPATRLRGVHHRVRRGGARMAGTPRPRGRPHRGGGRALSALRGVRSARRPVLYTARTLVAPSITRRGGLRRDSMFRASP